MHIRNVKDMGLAWKSIHIWTYITSIQTFGMSSVNVLSVKVTWQYKYGLATRTKKNIYFLPQSLLAAAGSENIQFSWRRKPLSFKISSEGLDFPTATHQYTVKYMTQYCRRVQVYNWECKSQTCRVYASYQEKPHVQIHNGGCCDLREASLSRPVYVCVWRGLETLPAAAEVTEGTPAWRLGQLPPHTVTLCLPYFKHPTLLANPLLFLLLSTLLNTPFPTHTLWPLRKGEGGLMQLAPLWAVLCWWIEVVWWATRLLAAVPALLDAWIYKPPSWHHRWTLFFNSHHFYNKWVSWPIAISYFGIIGSLLTSAAIKSI